MAIQATKKKVSKRRSRRRVEELEEEEPRHRPTIDTLKRNRRRSVPGSSIRITRELSLEALDLAQSMMLAGFDESKIREHMPDMENEWWEEDFLPMLRKYKERLNALAIQAMYLAAMSGKVEAQKCIAIMQMGWTSGENDWDEVEPLKITLTARRSKSTNGADAD